MHVTGVSNLMAAHMVALARKEVQPEYLSVSSSGATSTPADNSGSSRSLPVEPKRVRCEILQEFGFTEDLRVHRKWHAISSHGNKLNVCLLTALALCNSGCHGSMHAAGMQCACARWRFCCGL